MHKNNAMQMSQLLILIQWSQVASTIENMLSFFVVPGSGPALFFVVPGSGPALLCMLDI